MQTFRIVPVQGQPDFYNIVRNDNDVHVGMWDAENKEFRFNNTILFSEIEELVEQVKRLNTE